MEHYVHASFEWAWLIVAMPLLSFLIIGLVTKRWPKFSSIISIACILTSFALAIWVDIGVFGSASGAELVEKPFQNIVNWLTFDNVTLGLSGKVLNIEFGTLIDPISAMMLFVVTLVASLVQIYSTGYMKGDKGFSRYFAYQSLFAMSMLGLVLSTNLLQLFLFWELVGLCSYLLIGFWFFKPSAREAAKKAFITTRVGDFGLLLGILFLLNKFGTTNFHELFELIKSHPELSTPIVLGSVSYLTITAFLVFIGPIGKSGQFPLHVWLPDAMEGPTPVSALIHAATMVVAGVYLIARIFFLFEASPETMQFVAGLGGFTALFAATIAITQNDIKRILAYSTLSQLGYMVMALGVGSLTSSMFHLMTHAFFKALMFLGAGSVIHALHHKQDIWEMGGLWKKMKITGTTFFIGVLAISGIPPFAGFWSKDEILGAALKEEHYGLFVLGLVTAFLTAFYMSRLFIVAFMGDEKEENHPHESPWMMTLPLIILAVLSVVGGLVALPAEGFGFFVRAWGTEFEHEKFNLILMAGSSLVGAAGIGLAYMIYSLKIVSADAIVSTFPRIHKILYNKYYVDEAYLWLIEHVVNAFGRVLYWFDIYIVDGIVNACAWITRKLGDLLRKSQTGQLQFYALVFLAAVVVLFIIITYNEGQLSTLAPLGLGGGQ